MTIPASLVDRVASLGLTTLWDELARRMEISDRPVRSVRLTGLDASSRRALADLLGADRLPDADTTVRVSRVAASLGLDEDGLRGLVEHLHGPLGNRAAAAARDRAEREELWADAAKHVAGRGLEPWVGQLRAAGIPDGDVGAHRTRLRGVLAVLDELPAEPAVPLPLLAARVLGDPHALDVGNWTAGAVLDALAGCYGEDRATSAETQRALWARAGVICDRLSAPVLTSGLRCGSESPLARVLHMLGEAGEPAMLTASQLQQWPVRVFASTVWVVENPSVVEAARLAGVGGPLVCTASWPAQAAVLLLDQLGASGVELRYHSDLDAVGLALTGHMIDRFGAVPWRMSAHDYLSSRRKPSQVSIADPHGLPATPWEPELRRRMVAEAVPVFEEDVVDLLVGDLARG